MAALTSTVGWIDISPAALRTMRAELEGQEKGVLDEMGVGALHAGYADAFFPAVDPQVFAPVSRERHHSPADRGHGWDYDFVRYERRR